MPQKLGRGLSARSRLLAVVEIHAFCEVCGSHLVAVCPYREGEDVLSELKKHRILCWEHDPDKKHHIWMPGSDWQEVLDATHQS